MVNVKAESGQPPSSASSKRNRTAMSCDKCKSRKTKCNNPVPGPCDYCKTIGATCQIDVGKRKQRPYYFVSEEQYQHMAKLISHHYGPNLDVQTLRNLAQNIDNDDQGSSKTPATSVSARSPRKEPSLAGSSGQRQEDSKESQDGVPLEDIDSLHEQLGCMMQDSTGEYRYMSAASGISFNAAVRDLNPVSAPAKDERDKDVIPGLRTLSLPPATPQSPASNTAQVDVHMPPKQLGYQYVNKYFTDIHGLYWLYSTEQFHSRFEKSYQRNTLQSASWACSLYSIFALTSQRPYGSDQIDIRSSTEYLALAKALVPQVCDEADLDSVRALILLAIALQSHCFSTAAYLHVGIAARTAQSLGLHVDKYSLSHGFVEREHARRIWWTLYIFEGEVSLRCGKPRALTLEAASRQAPLPSEQVLDPGPNMPSGYLEISKKLTQLTETTTKTLYPEPLSAARKLLSPKVTEILSSLQAWANSVPSHLSRTACVAPSHKRAVALLHIRYWSVVILATRPFLLCSVIREADLDSPEKRRCYNELSGICIDAAQNSLAVLKMMADERILSGLLVSEFLYVLELVQCFLIAYQKTKNDVHVHSVRTCLTILNSMEDIGWVQKVRPETILQLKELGIEENNGSDGRGGLSAGDNLQDFSNFLVSGNSGGDDGGGGSGAYDSRYDMLFSADQAGVPGVYQFADMELPDHATADAMFAQIAGMSMPQFFTP